MIGTTIDVEIDNLLEDEAVATSQVIAATRHADGSLSGPFVVHIVLRRPQPDEVVPRAEALRPVAVETLRPLPCVACGRIVDATTQHALCPHAMREAPPPSDRSPTTDGADGQA